MEMLIELRQALLQGDLRALYLGWLLGVDGTEMVYLEDDQTEPPVPAGLGQLDASLDALIEILIIDRDLVEIAAEASAPFDDVVLPDLKGEQRAWLAAMDPAKAQRWLLRIFDREGARDELLLLAQTETIQPARKGRPSGRTVGELREKAAELRNWREEEKRRLELEENQRQERRAAKQRKQEVDALRPRREEAWSEVMELTTTTVQANYDRALEILVVLQNLSQVDSCEADFAARVGQLRESCRRKPSLIRRLDEAKM